MADPASSFEKHLADREFNSVARADVPDDRERGAVRRPIRLGHALEDFARSTARERHAGQRSRHSPGFAPQSELDQHLSRAGERQHVRVLETERF